MLRRPRPSIAALLALALLPASASAAASTCPNERLDASDSDNLGACLADSRDAKKAGEPRLAALAQARAVEFARRAYDAEKIGAATDWFTSAGEEIVFYATRECKLARELEPSEARDMLGGCIGLLEAYLADLKANAAAESAAAAATQTRLAELQALREATPPVQEPSTPPGPTSTERPNKPTLPPAPTTPSTTPDTPANTSPPPARPPPQRLQIGLGVSAGLAGLSVVGLVAAGVLGTKAAEAVDNAKETLDPDDARQICDRTPMPSSCSDLKNAKGLYIASGVFLGASLAATAVFTGLLVHDRSRRARLKAIGVAPTRDGFAVGVAIRF